MYTDHFNVVIETDCIEQLTVKGLIYKIPGNKSRKHAFVVLLVKT
jgi:hypothetical protein